jgi:hypothetical protein
LCFDTLNWHRASVPSENAEAVALSYSTVQGRINRLE